MSYFFGAELQRAVYLRLSTDQNLISEIGDAVFDSAPGGEVPLSYVSIGPEEVRDFSDQTGAVAIHFITVSVVTRESGFFDAKRIAQVADIALTGTALTIAPEILVPVHFQRARAKQIDRGRARQIDLTYRACVDHTGQP